MKHPRKLPKVCFQSRRICCCSPVLGGGVVLWPRKMRQANPAHNLPCLNASYRKLFFQQAFDFKNFLMLKNKTKNFSCYISNLWYSLSFPSYMQTKNIENLWFYHLEPRILPTFNIWFSNLTYDFTSLEPTILIQSCITAIGYRQPQQAYNSHITTV
jgi:hypothetical protein